MCTHVRGEKAFPEMRTASSMREAWNVEATQLFLRHSVSMKSDERFALPFIPRKDPTGLLSLERVG